MTRRRKAAAFIGIAFLLFLAVCTAFYYWFGIGWSIRSLSSPAILVQIKQLRQLATVRYSIQRVVGLRESKVPLGEESILLIVQGEAEAGVDLADLHPEDVIITGNGKALVRLPPAKLLNTYLDENQIKIWDRHITWWTPWVPYSPDLEHRARLQALDEIRRSALEMNILEKAQLNAETAIREVLGAFQVNVKFDKQSP